MTPSLLLRTALHKRMTHAWMISKLRQKESQSSSLLIGSVQNVPHIHAKTLSWTISMIPIQVERDRSALLMSLFKGVNTLRSTYRSSNRIDKYNQLQALHRLRALEFDPTNEVLWGNVAFSVRIILSARCCGSRLSNVDQIFNDLDVGLCEARPTGKIFLKWNLQHGPPHPQLGIDVGLKPPSPG